MKSSITRRSLSAVLLGAPALAQTATPANPQEASKPAPEEDPRAAASRQVRSSAEQLRKFAIAMETEPAFRFKA